MATNESRRSFIGFAFGTVAAGFTTVDLSGMNEGELRTIEWRKKPIFILKKSADMLKDPKRELSIENSPYVVMIGLCTHLGCIPSYAPSEGMF